MQLMAQACYRQHRQRPCLHTGVARVESVDVPFYQPSLWRSILTCLLLQVGIVAAGVPLMGLDRHQEPVGGSLVL